MGDFNVVTRAHERSSGHLIHATPSEDFKDFIAQRDLFDIEGTGNKYTWATRRSNRYIAARLDRSLASQNFLNLWTNVELLILPIICSDHSPLRLRLAAAVPNTPRAFRFQDMWTMHDSFQKVVRDYWTTPTSARNPTIRLIRKLKRLRGTLKKWNMETFWNIHTEIQ